MTITIVETGLANIASVRAAFKRLGRQTRLTNDPNEVRQADRVVLPGVGSFGAGMTQLNQLDLVEPLRTRIADDRPTLGICLGLQLLATQSEESIGVKGLSCLQTEVKQFPGTVKCPQFGWNWIANENTSVLGEGGYVYYANSYRLTQCPDGWSSGWTKYGGDFVGCLQRGSVVACQFHPELSGAYGSEVIKRWLSLGSKNVC